MLEIHVQSPICYDKELWNNSTFCEVYACTMEDATHLVSAFMSYIGQNILRHVDRFIVTYHFHRMSIHAMFEVLRASLLKTGAIH